MNITTDETLDELDGCGCCEGTGAVTPVAINNRPGLSAIAYRVGTHARFLESMLAALSDARRPSLRNLNTRDPADFSVALLDAWATVADVLTFYQERVANESFLRTATERRSVAELMRALGNELRPGVAAATSLAFTLDSAPGAPGAATIPAGTRAQSIPGPGEKPQTFETVEELEARAAWNLLLARAVAPQQLRQGATRAYIKGVATNLKAGDPLLLVGPDREDGSNMGQWEFRRLLAVEVEREQGRTLVEWDAGLNDVMGAGGVAVAGLKVFALRQRANVFGYNAPDFRAMPTEIQNSTLANSDKSNWKNFNVVLKDGAGNNTDLVDLDVVYQKITKGGWLVLTLPGGARRLYSIADAVEAGRADYTLTGKVTRITLGGPDLTTFDQHLRSTGVFAESEELELAETAIESPVTGRRLVLASAVEGLERGRKLIVTGRRPRARVTGNPVIALGGATPPDLSEDFFVNAPAAQLDATNWSWSFEDRRGVEFQIVAAAETFVSLSAAAAPPADAVLLMPSAKTDEPVSELVTLHSTEEADARHTVLVFEEDLRNVFDRASVTVFANVAAATHGETTSEVLGSGDASRPFQEFTLRQAPLTYTGADTPSGVASTLEVRVNGLPWQEAETLYGMGPKDRVYITQLADGGVATVKFGDGVSGARLPTGSENVEAEYRKGIGLEGQVKARQLSLLMTRPLGVSGVVNPLAASGAADPQATADAGQNAPLTVLTLDRIVSLRDYEDFARSYAGVAKALATWVWSGRTRGLLVTVAGSDGAEIAAGGPLHTRLLSAIIKAGDASVPLTVKSYQQRMFTLAASVKAKEEYEPGAVLAAVEAALRGRFSFAARGFGQPVARSEIVAVIHTVPGVEFVNLTQLYRTDGPAGLSDVLGAHVPSPGAGADAAPAELLTLDETQLVGLEVY
ncbi:MAG TPA: putative baseplate assembly protein [Pyrinomonadaceae bacterium]|jgi:hypothetical protein